MTVGKDSWTTDKRRFRIAAALAFASQLLHLWVLPGEFVARPLTGFLIFLVAVCQGLLATRLLIGPGRWTVRFGILLNACVVLAWAVTRFVSFPLLLGFKRLAVEPTNLAAVLIEVALIVVLVRIGRDLNTKPRGRRVWWETRR